MGNSTNSHALHAQDDDRHTVFLGNLSVLVSHEGDEWFAQGVEVDYGAAGDSLEDVQRRFESGLEATIHAHIDRFGTIERLLKFAPESEYRELTEAEPYQFALITFHQVPAPFPFKGITYLGRPKEAA
ncbi:MAG: hypothetical protein MN733_26810 [Nitrososphaera sp.]|nr:hypothetical protein [Nitrososphaera sp.]